MTERAKDEGTELRMPSDDFDRMMRQTFHGAPASNPAPGKPASRSRPKAKRARRRAKK